MAVMLKAYTRNTCTYGRKCCDYDRGFEKGGAKTLRRRQRAREKQALRQER